MIEQIKTIVITLENYNGFRLLKEERLTSDDIVQQGAEYRDQVETRRSISKHLKPLATRIRNLPFVKDCCTDISPDKIKRGLSNYIEITFNYPNGISREEKNKYYRYTIRFSDHEDVHNEERTRKTSYVDMVGRKVKNLGKAGMKLFWDSLSDIEKNIHDFEIEKFGKIKTFITGNDAENRPINDVVRESLKLKISESILTERLESIGNSIYCTDYAGNIADMLLNKPKAYRLLYDSYFDIWCIADANLWTHDAMAKDMFGSGYVEENASNQEYTSFMYDANQWLNTYLRGYKLSDREIYKSYGFNRLYLIGFMFIPYSDNYRKYEESGFYSTETRLTTGNLFTYDNYQLSSNGVLKDLYKALEQKNAFVDSLDNIWRRNIEMFGEDAIDYFYQEAEEYGYDEEEIQDFLEFHLADIFKG